MLNRVKSLLGITDDSKDDIIEFLIASVTDMALSYCRIEDIPARMENVVIRMAVDMYRMEGYGGEERPKTVSGVSAGAVSVSFERTDDKAFLSSYAKLLEPFRNRKGRLPSEL